MPITQERLIKVVEIADASIARVRALNDRKNKNRDYLRENGLESDITAVRAALYDLFAQIEIAATIPSDTIATIAREGEHFRVVQARNKATAKHLKGVRLRRKTLFKNTEYPQGQLERPDQLYLGSRSDERTEEVVDLSSTLYDQEDMFGIIDDLANSRPNSEGSYITSEQIIEALETRAAVTNLQHVQAIMQRLLDKGLLIQGQPGNVFYISQREGVGFPVGEYQPPPYSGLPKAKVRDSQES